MEHEITNKPSVGMNLLKGFLLGVGMLNLFH